MQQQFAQRGAGQRMNTKSVRVVPQTKRLVLQQPQNKRLLTACNGSIYHQYGFTSRYRLSSDNARKSKNYTPTPGVLGTNAGKIDWWHEVGIHMRATVIAFEKDCYVVDVRHAEREGYYGALIGYKQCPASECSRADLELFDRVGVPPLKWLREFRVNRPEDLEGFEPGQLLKPWEMFEVGDRVDLSGLSRNRGFQGSIKRWGIRGGRKTRGCKNVRGPGSSGPSTTPGLVRKRKKFPGPMGLRYVIMRHCEVLRVDSEERCMIVRGSPPGEFGSVCQISDSKRNGHNFFPPRKELMQRPWWMRYLYEDKPLEF